MRGESCAVDGSVAQLDRATAFEAVGRRFESCRGRQSKFSRRGQAECGSTARVRQRLAGALALRLGLHFAPRHFGSGRFFRFSVRTGYAFGVLVAPLLARRSVRASVRGLGRRRASIGYAKPDPRSPPTADSMSGGGYCVRACDGYYFPLIKSSLISGQQSCELACPSARVQLYEGASIEQARNAKGDRYSALPVGVQLSRQD